MALDADRLRASIDGIVDLPTLPAVVAKITNQIANPATNAADIGRLIEQDQALTGRVLRLVNSAYYGFPKQIKSVQHAVVILGFNKIKTIIITASVFGAFRKHRSERLDLPRFWQHSLAVAIASKVAAEHLEADHAAEDAFVGGLLHDVGKVVMDQYQPTIYSPIVKYANDKGILLLDAEREVMGITHAAIGGWMMEKWRLPQTIVALVADHHSPVAVQERRQALISIQLGDILARSLGVGNGGDQRIPAIDPAVATGYAIDGHALDALVRKTIREITRGEEFFTLVTGDP